MSAETVGCVRETAGEFVVTLDVPAFSSSDLAVEATPRTLFVSAARAGAQLRRRFDLRTNVDPYRVTALLDDGVLEIHARKTANLPPHRVEIECTRSGLHADATPC
jgi:HSP20 family molecular chaperone IbpA